jgi:hypothetical protein
MVNRWQQMDGVHMDLRGLMPPEPMINILREIDGGADGPLIVHMDRDPILLYQELEDRGWSARPYPGGEKTAMTTAAEQAPVILELKPDA